MGIPEELPALVVAPRPFLAIVRSYALLRMCGHNYM